MPLERTDAVIEAAKKFRAAFVDYQTFKRNRAGSLDKEKMRRAREALFSALENLEEV